MTIGELYPGEFEAMERQGRLDAVMPKQETMIMMNALEGVKAQIRKAYDKGYKDGQADTPFTDTEEAEKKAYNRGLNDAWDAARKLHEISVADLSELFDMKSPYFDFSVQEVINKIKEYEDKQEQASEIKVGDEVMTKYAECGIAVRDTYYIGVDKEPFTLIWFGTHMSSCPVNKLVKTGRTYKQIAEIMAELRDAESENDE